MDLDDPSFVLGMPEELITTTIDVTPWLDRKRRAIEAHASQVVDTGFFLAMPPDAFARALSTEFYIRRGVPAGHRDDDLFAGVADGRGVVVTVAVTGVTGELGGRVARRLAVLGPPAARRA